MLLYLSCLFVLPSPKTTIQTTSSPDHHYYPPWLTYFLLSVSGGKSRNTKNRPKYSRNLSQTTVLKSFWVHSYRAVRRVRAPQVGTGPRAVVSIVTTRLVDPFPVQVTAEVDVEPANAAALLGISLTKHRHESVGVCVKSIILRLSLALAGA